MISKEDCIALCGLTAEEVDAIAEHEHIGEVAAAALADYLLHKDHGTDRIRAMIVDDIRAALRDGRPGHAGELVQVLRRFLAAHPDAAAGG
jgi:hypothetical protein